MKRISSGKTFFLKRIFPLVFFGMFVVTPWVAWSGSAEKDVPVFVFMVPSVLMAVVWFVVMKNLIWNLADEVFDCRDFLLVRNRGEEESVPLTNIMNVSISVAMNPPRITLRLANPGKFGKEIAFCPVRPFTLNPFAKDPVFEDLIVRVDHARAKRAV
jgi:hypothetical protein